jgi:hypothetical protein
MIGRKKEQQISDSPPNPGPEAVGKGPSDEFDEPEDKDESKQSDLKPGSQPDGTASGISDGPNREPGIENGSF